MEYQVQHHFIANLHKLRMLMEIPQTCHTHSNRDRASCQAKVEVAVVVRQATVKAITNKLLTLLVQATAT